MLDIVAARARLGPGMWPPPTTQQMQRDAQTQLFATAGLTLLTQVEQAEMAECRMWAQRAKYRAIILGWQQLGPVSSARKHSLRRKRRLSPENARAIITWFANISATRLHYSWS
jgi:hypothetical protein